VAGTVKRIVVVGLNEPRLNLVRYHGVLAPNAADDGGVGRARSDRGGGGVGCGHW